jgi:hypothetical protein
LEWDNVIYNQCKSNHPTKRNKLNKNKEAEDDTTSTQLPKNFLEAMAIARVKSMPLNR